MVVVVLLLIYIDITYTFSCHSCTSLQIKEVSKSKAREHNEYSGECFDSLSQNVCISKRHNDMCIKTKSDMQATCNKTCDLCRFKANGEMRESDTEYWGNIYSQARFTYDFEIQNQTIFTSEASSIRDDLLAEYGPNNSIDGNMSSYFWSSIETEPYVVVSLGGVLAVHYVVVVNRWGEGVGRADIIPLEGAVVSVLHYPPDGGDGTGNRTVCGSVRVREGYSLERQSYRITCSTVPLANHVKISNNGYSSLQIAEIKVGSTDPSGECGEVMREKCDDYLNSDQCYKIDYSGLWHGRELVYSARGCYYPNTTTLLPGLHNVTRVTQPNTTNCAATLELINDARFAHLNSGYDTGGYDPNAFQLSECTRELCNKPNCNYAVCRGPAAGLVCLTLLLYNTVSGSNTLL